MNGEGKIVYLNGDEYSGMKKDNERDGKGTYTYNPLNSEGPNRGISIEGVWENNERIQGITLKDKNAINGKWEKRFK